MPVVLSAKHVGLGFAPYTPKLHLISAGLAGAHASAERA